MGNRVRFGMRIYKGTQEAREGLTKGSCTASGSRSSQWTQVSYESVIWGTITDRIAEREWVVDYFSRKRQQ
jgi:hypothetical protein